MDNSVKSYWVKTQIQGLYERRTTALPKTVRGVFYSRYRMNGKQTFRSLETNTFEHAKNKHAARGVTIEKDRRKGVTLSDKFVSLGTLMAEVERRFAETPVSKNTELNRSAGIARLRKNWQAGDFEAFPARSCTAEVIAKFRDYLLEKAPWRYHFGSKFTYGYGAPAVNYSLWVLKNVLDLAVEKTVIPENPFRATQVLRDTLIAKSKPVERTGATGEEIDLSRVPSRPDMLRILAEIRRQPFAVPASGLRAMLAIRAIENADHAELIAFSGMRIAESRASILADDTGDEFLIRGTKSKTSWRKIPVSPALRAVLDRIKSRRIGEKTPLVVTDQPYLALRRACVRLGLSEMTNHDLRHFFASACIASGIDVPTVSRWLGHADGGALCMRVYAHLLRDHSQAAAQKVNFSGAALQVAI